MTCQDDHRVKPLPEHKYSRARTRWKRDLEGHGRNLATWKNYFGVTELYDVVYPLIHEQLPALTQVNYEIGIWYVRGAGELTNCIAVDVAREFPGSIGIPVFERAAEYLGQRTLDRLRCTLAWRPGSEYDRTRKERRLATHTVFLIGSVDYWNEHRSTFVQMATDINLVASHH